MKQVFVFGSNAAGFHGAGSAGFAFRGNARNTWRQDSFFLDALAKSRQTPPVLVRGKLAVFGQARGFQQGTEGSSYAICTVTRPGAKRSISRRDICKQFIELWKFAKAHPELEFRLTPVGCGYAGYSAAEMQEVLAWVIGKYGKPENIRNLDCYSKKISTKMT
jgi:hypothetical protein